MIRRPGRRTAAALGLAGLAVGVTVVVVRQVDRLSPAAATASVTAELGQYREDEVRRTIQVSVTNRGTSPVVVDRVGLTVPGFAMPGPVTVSATIAPGSTVDLPTTYGEPRCAGPSPAAGTPHVQLWLQSGSGLRQTRLVPTGIPLLQRILDRECLARALGREVRLSFGPWRRETVAGQVRLHGTLEARLVDPTRPRDLTEVAGTVIYELAPDGPARSPLARLDAARPSASVPVVVSVSRCDGHARGETKQPYAFLVWLAAPGGPQQAVTPAVSTADRRELQTVCPL